MWRATRTMGKAALLVSVLVVIACDPGPKIAYKELLDEDPAVRADAARRLGEAKSPEAVESLIAILDDPDEDVRIEATQALGAIGDTRATPTLTAMAEDPRPTVRLAACRALGMIRDPASMPTLSKLLYDTDDSIRLVATRALGDIPGPESLDILLNFALRDESEDVRALVVRVIGERRAREAIPKLESILMGEADLVRAYAAEVLGMLGDRSTVPALIRALDDPFYKVRSLAAHSLSRVAPDDMEARGAIKGRVGIEKHHMSQVDLAWSLARMGDRSEMDLVRDLLFRGDPEDVRAEAAMALGEVGDESDIERLERATNDKKGLVRKQAVLALYKLGKKV